MRPAFILQSKYNFANGLQTFEPEDSEDSEEEEEEEEEEEFLLELELELYCRIQFK